MNERVEYPNDVTRELGYDEMDRVAEIAWSGYDGVDADSREYTWADDYRLSGVSVDGAAVAEYAYDVLGNLVAVANGEEPFEILVDGGHSLADVTADGTPLRVYMRGPGVDSWLGFVDMTGSAPVPYYYVTDHLGSVLAVVDAAGNVVERYEYDAWGKVLSVTDADGEPLARSAIGNRILWQGREYSWMTGLYYFRNRWYDPTIGRWISKDPIGINGGINLYLFCNDNPVCARDPSGWCPKNRDPQKEKDKIKALRNGMNGTSLIYAIRAGVQMNGNIIELSDENPEFPLMDFKASGDSDTWLFGASDSRVLSAGTVLKNNQMGNYMAGYTAGYSDYPAFLYLGVRAGGMLSGKDNREGWTDRESVPDIRHGFIDGYFDFVADHPIRALNRIDYKSLGVISAAMLIDSLF